MSFLAALVSGFHFYDELASAAGTESQRGQKSLTPELQPPVPTRENRPCTRWCINIASRRYKTLDASDWPLLDSGLLGPVRLVPMNKLAPK
jgi:hypothetical protein